MIGGDSLWTKLDELKDNFHDRGGPRRRSAWRFRRREADERKGSMKAGVNWPAQCSSNPLKMRMKAKGKVEVELSLQKWMIWWRWSSFMLARAVRSARSAATPPTAAAVLVKGGGWLHSIWWRTSAPIVSVCSRSLGDDVNSIRSSELDISCRREFLPFSNRWNQMNK